MNFIDWSVAPNTSSASTIHIQWFNFGDRPVRTKKLRDGRTWVKWGKVWHLEGR